MQQKKAFASTELQRSIDDFNRHGNDASGAFIVFSLTLHFVHYLLRSFVFWPLLMSYQIQR
jgi:hypothetical protein